MSVIMTPSQGANLRISHYARSIIGALYNRMQALPRFKERAEKIHNSLIVRRLARVSHQTLAATSNGTGFNYSDLAPTQFTLEPVWLVVAVAMPDSSPRRMGDEIEPATKKDLDAAMSAALDYTVLAEFTALSATPFGGPASDIDSAILRGAVQAVETNSRRRAMGGDNDIHLLLSTTQISASLGIPEITHADQRGDGKGPLVTGKVSKGLGLNFDYTTLLTLDANGYNGAVFHGEAVHYGWNQRPRPQKQQYELQSRFIVDAELGFETVMQELAVPIRTQ